MVEPVRDAAIREAKEEWGLEIELIDDRPLDVFNNLILDKVGRLRYHYMLLQFRVRPKGGTLQPTSNVNRR